ncbi:hypothetical protein LCGC14_1088650 [marine sediment metagenome]|uniref:DUF669 domain-containing protein n=1 Tax=marine sediment metagenome TaxID=412755 RepID=A0A0F9N0S5_9ZZZZ
MANTMEFDFTGAPPAQGKAGGDRIAPGTYLMEVGTLDSTPAKSGRAMVTATLVVKNDGPAVGKKLVERFAFPKPGSDDSTFGLQRFHAFLVACGMKERKGTLSLDLDKLVGKELVAEVDDEFQEASGNFAARTVSRPLAFHRTKSPEAANVGQTTAVPAAAPASAPAAVAEAPVAAEAPAPAETAEDDDLFADLE